MIQRLRTFGARLVHRLRRPSRPALNELDRKLARYLDFEAGFFIEAGANDGYSQSNTYFLETRRGWRGLLVEGMPELYERCKVLRKRSRVVHCALVSSAYSKPTAVMRFAHLMSVVDGSLKRQEDQQRHIELGIEVQGLGGSYSVEVPARTLESLLDEIAGLPRIDLLSLDVEGYELQVLQGINLDRYQPRFILVEARFFEEVDNYLSPRYEMIERMTHHDYLYRLRAGPRDAAASQGWRA